VPDWLPHERLRFEGNSGADLAGRWFAAMEPVGTVVLAHPDRRYGQHWFVLTGWVDALHDAGYHVLTFDFADYGESRGGSTYYFEDVIAAAHVARTRAPEAPVHLVGLSMGAYAVANAAPHLDFVESLILESPYPNFNSWYGRSPGRLGMWLFDRLFPKTSTLIQAPRSLGQATARRVLVAASNRDRVTPSRLSRDVATGGPADRTTYLEFDGPAHLELWTESPAYRDAVLATLEGRALDLGHAQVATRVRTTRSAAAHGQPLSLPSRTP